MASLGPFPIPHALCAQSTGVEPDGLRGENEERAGERGTIMFEQLLGGTKESLIGALASKLGIGTDQAGGFLQRGLSMLEGGLKSGQFDASSLTSGNISGILSKLDLNQLGGFVGGDAGKARTGMETILGGVTNAAQSVGGADKLMDMLGAGQGGGGVMNRAAGMAGKFFGKH